MTPAAPGRVLGSVTPDVLPSRQHHCNGVFAVLVSVTRMTKIHNPLWFTNFVKKAGIQ